MNSHDAKARCTIWQISSNGHLVCSILLAWIGMVFLSLSVALAAPFASTVDSIDPRPLILEDPLEPFQPTQPRTEQEEDRHQALLLFSTARMLQKQGESAKALRLYQRAFHYDPDQKTIYREIFLLAAELNRDDEAVRYGLKAVASGNVDSSILRALGLRLAQQADFERAAAMYDQLLARETPPDAQQVARWMEAGKVFHLAEQHIKAAEQFAQVIDAIEHPNRFGLVPNHREALLGDAALTYSLIAESFLQAERWDEAIEAFKNRHEAAKTKAAKNEAAKTKAAKTKAAKTKAANDVALEFALVRVDAERNNPQRALDRLLPLLDDQHKTLGMAAYQLLAELLKSLDREQELFEQLEPRWAERLDDAPLGYFLAQQYLLAERLDKAEPLYRSLIEKTPTLTGYRSLIDIYHRRQSIDRLLEILIEVVSQTSALEPLGKEGQAVIDDPKLVEKLFVTADRRLASDPKSFDGHAHLTMALLALDAKRFDDSDRFFQQAVDASPKKKHDLLLTWGLTAFFDERHEKAIEVMQQGIDDAALSESADDFYYYQATSLTLIDRIDEALVAARKALKLKKDSPRILSRIAWIHYHGDQLDKATEIYENLLERYDSQFDTSEIRQIVRDARLALSNVHVLNDNLPQAERRLEEVLDEFPDDISALNDLGYLWADQSKRLDRAERMILQAVEGDPQNAAYRDSLGWIYYRQKRFDDAIIELQKAVEAEPDPVVLDHLGDAYQAAGKVKKAKQIWKRAINALREQDEQENVEAIQKKIRG